MIGVNAVPIDGSPSASVDKICKADFGVISMSDKLGFLKNKFEILGGEAMASSEINPQVSVLGQEGSDSVQSQSDRRVNPLDLANQHNEGRVISNDPQKSKMVEASIDGPHLVDQLVNRKGERDFETPHLTFDPRTIVDRVERLKSSNPNLAIGAPSTPGTPRWSDRSENKPSVFHRLPESLDIARNRGDGKSREVTEGDSRQPSNNVRKNLQAFLGQEEHKEDISFGDNLDRGGANTRGGRGNRGRGGGRGSGNHSGKSWAEITNSSTRSQVSLRYFPPTVKDDFISVDLPPRPNPLRKWDSCLVGYFFGKGVNFNYMKNNAFSMWKNKGLKEVLANGGGFIFFIFDNPECCFEVLEGGHWYIGGFNIILKKWKRMMKLSKEKVTKVPVWVRFYNIPLEYWDDDGLGRIASAVGNPLFTDQLTTSGGLPAKCEHCVAFGHDTTRCVTTQVAKLVSLQKETEENPTEPGWTTIIAKGKMQGTHGTNEEEGLTSNLQGEVSLPDQIEATDEELLLNREVPFTDQAKNSDSVAEDNRPAASQILAGSSADTGEDVPYIEGLQEMKTSLADIISLIIPQDPTLLEEVQKFKDSTPGSPNAIPVPNQPTPAKGKSSGKSSNSQRKKKRGLNDPSKHRELKNFVVKEDIKVMGILETKIRALSASDQHIFCKITDLTQASTFLACFVYADNNYPLRRVFCETMKEEFNSYILASELDDLSYSGCQFTWANKRDCREYIATKIDRVLVNESWLDKFSNSTAIFLPSTIFDHSSAVVTVSDVVTSYKKPFKVCQKLRNLKPGLRDLNKKDFSDISTRVLVAKSDLESVQCKLDKDLSNLILQNLERTNHRHYVDLCAVEESLAHQKSKVDWFGSKILSIELDDYRKSSKSEDIHQSFISFFTNVFGTPLKDQYNGFERINSLVQSRVSMEQSINLGSPVSDKEIKDVVWSLKANKAPGPDGFTGSFFKASWDIVGNIIIALIPKVPSPLRVGDFRPISCCNTIYKCIAKIIANRIKAVLPDLIDPVQSAFVQGRRISDNIFLSQELMRGYHRQSVTPKCAMKVDIMKAYDTVRREFVIDVLKAMAFPLSMISWIKACITSPSFSICINGSLHGYFKGARGLRQGDPMSPYLFVLAMEILARILAEKSKHHLFKFHWKCEKTKIVNLCFADDLMIFSKGDASTVQLIMHGLEEFKSLSGLTPSAGKSNIFFCGCGPSLREEILKIVKFNEGTLSVKYLGVPLITTKLRALDCQQLIDRITSRIKSWTNKALSYAGRAQFIQTILFSMQVYWSSLFILPKKVVREIENLLRAFLWSGVDLKNHSAKIAWDKVCAPKYEGGLGFKSLEVWNRAAIAKHMVPFLGGEKSMWCQWVKSYLLKGKSFWTGVDLKNHSVKIAWDKVCTPKYEGGLGFKSLEVWNRAAIAKHIWFLFSGGEKSMWCQWVKSYLLKGKSFWKVSVPSDPSWVWDAIKVKCNVKWPDIFWPDIVHVAIRESMGKSLRAITTRLALLCTVYQVWIERNNRIFNMEMKPEEVVIKSIVQMIRGRLMSLNNLPRSASDEWFLKQWNLTDSILKPRTLVVSVSSESGLSEDKEAIFECSEVLYCGPSDERNSTMFRECLPSSPNLGLPCCGVGAAGDPLAVRCFSVCCCLPDSYYYLLG
ncbi:uncharacterized protein LOC114275708 [Camellia sinensis]|uniref:uncharacterized protein LOC114275708 n=1 Tax=Camellia sinensis TaxID=4442 RepID=UPI001036227A|nr:uncharacterized protein LOC114275708 [Camellia sinensis]